MRKAIVLLLTLAIAGCSSSTEPGTAGDPSFRFTNNMDHDYVYITWRDGEGIAGSDSIPPRTAFQCVRFTARPDSASFTITATLTNPNRIPIAWHGVGGTAWFFNPDDHPAWKVIVSDDSSIYAWDKYSPPPSYAVDNPEPC